MCTKCNKKWYVDEHLYKQITCCPFCSCEYIHEKEQITIDSVDRAIYAIINEAGIDVLQDKKRFLAYLNDIAIDFKKEVKIISKACETRILAHISDAASQDYNDATLTMQKVRMSLIEDEGMSDKWADMICDWFFKAIHSGISSSENNIPASVVENTVISATPIAKDDTASSYIVYQNNPQTIVEKLESIDYPEVTPSSPSWVKKDLSDWVKKQKAKHNKLEQLVITGEKYVISENEYSGQKFTWLILGEQVKRISKNAFANCDIQMVYIPSSVEVIEDYAFSNNNINFIAFEDTSIQQRIASNAFNNYPTQTGAQHKQATIACHKDNMQIRSYCAENRLNQRGLGPLEKAFMNYARIKIGQLPISKIYDSDVIRELALYSPAGFANEVRINGSRDITDISYRNNDNFQVLSIKNTSEIPAGIFEGCRNLKYLVMDSTIEKIADNAFKDCSSLEYIIFIGENRNRTISDDAFSSRNNIKYIACSEKDLAVKEYCSKHQIDCKLYDYYVGSCPREVRALKRYLGY